jgi:hypothetical protein
MSNDKQYNSDVINYINQNYTLLNQHLSQGLSVICKVLTNPIGCCGSTQHRVTLATHRCSHALIMIYYYL